MVRKLFAQTVIANPARFPHYALRLISTPDWSCCLMEYFTNGASEKNVVKDFFSRNLITFVTFMVFGHFFRNSCNLLADFFPNDPPGYPEHNFVWNNVDEEKFEWFWARMHSSNQSRVLCTTTNRSPNTQNNISIAQWQKGLLNVVRNRFEIIHRVDPSSICITVRCSAMYFPPASGEFVPQNLVVSFLFFFFIYLFLQPLTARILRWIFLVVKCLRSNFFRCWRAVVQSRESPRRTKHERKTFILIRKKKTRRKESEWNWKAHTSDSTTRDNNSPQ